MDPKEDGHHHHAHIVEFIPDHEHGLKLSDGEDSTDSITVAGDANNDSNHMSVICANDLVGCTFLMDPREDGQHHHAHIVEFIQDHEHDLKLSHDHHKFRVSINDNEY